MSSTHERIALLGGDPAWSNQWSLGGLEFYGELMDIATNSVWLSCEPITPLDYAALEAPDGFRKSGVGRSAHDAAFFLRPPGTTVDGPVESVRVGARSFGLVARPGKPEPGFTNVMVLPVYKSHRVLFAAGRTLEVIDIGHGWSLIPQATDSQLGNGPTRGSRPARVLPEGWEPRLVTIDRDLVVDLPYPARVAIFANGDIFHGPVRLTPA
ncbi:unannotated protein [freshwater metagenome]|uniref:Unannotated protein n=1 Tax=freshwater metagenome TaxID=449393 RepID=A0A6J7EMF8_9ZZZZ|nr:hypothetical protein [Actinomycetota bacterium]